MEKTLDRFVWRYSARQQIVIAALTVVSFPFLYLSLELPKRIINDAITGAGVKQQVFGLELGPFAYLLLLCLAFLAVVLANGLVKMRLNTLKGITGERMVRRLRYQLIERLLRFPPRHFERVSQGELISLINAETEPLAGYIGEALALPLFQGGTMLTILAFMFIQNWVLGVASVALIPLQIWLIPRLQRQINQLSKQRVQRSRKLSERIGELVSGAQEIRLQGTQRYALAEMSYRLGEIYYIRLRIFQKKFMMKFLNNFINQLTPFFFFLFGGWLVIEGRLTLGALVAALAAYKDLTDPWKELLAFYQQRQDARVKYEQIVEQFTVAHAYEGPFYDQHTPPEGALAAPLVLSNVATVNDLGERVLSGVHMEIQPGQWVAVVDENQIRRDHLLSVLTRLREPVSGRIIIGGTALEDIPTPVLARRLAAQRSEPFIFNSTITENVLYGLNYRPPAELLPDDSFDPEEALAAGNSPDRFLGCWWDYQSLGLPDERALLDWDLRVAKALEADNILFERGLMEIFDPRAQPKLAARLLEARRRVRDALAHSGLEEVVHHFNPESFNPGLSVAENITFALQSRLSGRGGRRRVLTALIALLEAEDLTHLGEQIGAELARRVSRACLDDPGGIHVVERFEFLDVDELERVQRLAHKATEQDPASLKPEERDELLRLFLSIIPERHGPDLIGARLQVRLVEARRRFAETRPSDLAIVPLDEERYHPGLTVFDNVIFGRIVQGSAVAERRLHQLVRVIFDEMDLTRAVQLLQAESLAGIHGARLPVVTKQRIAIMRCLVKRPDILILNDALSAFDEDTQRQIRRNIRALFPLMTVIWMTRAVADESEFDQVIHLETMAG
ncbi:MAG TPA: ABC transporter transmembrane domain-containing protein [Candidatus Competibacteraceae bacterium]|nr:ABC transporter transmembrane domain-containing protein [Candidatus Competibacteraceae bacterium]